MSCMDRIDQNARWKGRLLGNEKAKRNSSERTVNCDRGSHTYFEKTPEIGLEKQIEFLYSSLSGRGFYSLRRKPAYSDADSIFAPSVWITLGDWHFERKETVDWNSSQVEQTSKSETKCRFLALLPGWIQPFTFGLKRIDWFIPKGKTNKLEEERQNQSVII